VGDGTSLSQGDINELFFTIGYALANGTNDISGFTNANANLAIFIANDDDGPEAEFFPALNNLADAANLNNPLLPVGFFFFFFVASATFCHNFLHCGKGD
jgi:hypothetical protein